MLEPCTGDAFRKILMRLLGTSLSFGIAMLVLWLGAQAHTCLLSFLMGGAAASHALRLQLLAQLPARSCLPARTSVRTPAADASRPPVYACLQPLATASTPSSTGRRGTSG